MRVNVYELAEVQIIIVIQNAAELYQHYAGSDKDRSVSCSLWLSKLRTDEILYAPLGKSTRQSMLCWIHQGLITLFSANPHSHSLNNTQWHIFRYAKRIWETKSVTTNKPFQSAYNEYNCSLSHALKFAKYKTHSILLDIEDMLLILNNSIGKTITHIGIPNSRQYNHDIQPGKRIELEIFNHSFDYDVIFYIYLLIRF